MSLAENLDTADRRRAAVAAAIARIRRIETEAGVNRPALERIREALLDLAADASLFPPEDFPLGANDANVIYRLAEDADGRFALYMSTGKEGKETPPHDHTTWAVIVGVRGLEHNRFYERSDDLSVPGRGTVREVGRATVRHGSGVTLLPEDIHSIHLQGEAPTLMLHMYGLALDRLYDRVAYNTEEGTYMGFPPNSAILDAR